MPFVSKAQAKWAFATDQPFATKWEDMTPGGIKSLPKKVRSKGGKKVARKKKKGKKGTLFGKPRGQVIKHPGAFTAKAKAAGMSTGAYAEKVTAPGSKASAATKKQAGLDKAFATMRGRKRGRKKGSATERSANAAFKKAGY